MSGAGRYVKAFVGAVRLTLRGETVAPPAPAHPLMDWARQTLPLVAAVRQTAAAAGLDVATLKIRVDGRAVSVETLLAAVQFHAAQEYPNLLRNAAGLRGLNAAYATNFNDHYAVLKLLEAPELQASAVQHSLQRLANHLEQPPPA
jgi:hypothetical protein